MPCIRRRAFTALKVPRGLILPGEISSADAVVENIAKGLVGGRAHGLGVALKNGDAVQVSKQAQDAWGWHDVSHGESATLAIVHLFFSLLDPGVENKNESQMLGEFVLFLFLQAQQELTRLSYSGKENLSTKWPDSQESSAAGDSSEAASHESPLYFALGLTRIASENDDQLAIIKSKAQDICWLLALCEAEPTAKESKAAFFESFASASLSLDLARALQLIISSESDMFSAKSARRIRCQEIVEIIQFVQLNGAVNPALARAGTLVANGLAPISQSETSGQGSAPKRVFISNVNRCAKLESDADPKELVSCASGEPTSLEVPTIGLPGKAVASLQINVLDKAVVFNCSYATVYCLWPTTYTRIVGCTNCTIVLGPCAGVVSVEYCNDVHIIGIAEVLSVFNCHDSSFAVQTTHAPPILTADSHSLVFGPFNTFYPRLDLHLGALRAFSSHSQDTFLWKTPIDLTIGESSAVFKTFSLLSPAQFDVFVTPFQEPTLNAKVCKENPVGLPPEYSKAMQQKVMAVEELLRKIALAKKGNEEQSDCASGQVLEHAVQAHFKDWMLNSGNIHEVLDLLTLSNEEFVDN